MNATLSRQQAAGSRRRAAGRGAVGRISASPWLCGENNRRGVLLLVVVGLLAMFALIGLTFVILASHQQKAAEAQARLEQYAESPEELLNETLLQVVRGTRKPGSPLHSQSLLEDEHGLDVVSGVVTAAAASGADPTCVELTAKGLSSEELSRCQPADNIFPILTLVDGPVAPLSLAGRDFQIVGVASPATITVKMPTGITASDAATALNGFLGSESITFVVSSLPRRMLTTDVTPVAGGQLIQLSLPNANQHVGQIFTMLEGPAAGLSTRIVGLNPNDTTNTQAHIVAYDRVTVAQINAYRAGATPPVIRYILNGRAFGGTGVGYDPDATGTNPQLTEIDPELAALGWQAPTARLPGAPITRAIPGGANEDYDAADYQNMPLALQDPATGRTPIPSLHRPELVDYWFHQLLTSPPAWFSWPSNATTEADKLQAFLMPYGETCLREDAMARWEWSDIAIADRLVFFKRRIILRPSREDHPNFTGGNPAFNPLWDGYTPGGGNWDVDCDGDGMADSIWIDVGLPVRADKQGRLYKPLAAILCVDLDGRLNLNAHGSLAQTNAGYGSATNLGTAIVPDASGTPTSALNVPRGQCAGPAEVSLLPVLSGASEYSALLAGRYGADSSPGQAGGDPLAVNKHFDYPHPMTFDPSTTDRTRSYGTALDLTGGMAVGLDLRGQPLYVPLATAGTPPVNGFGLALYDNPYETNLLASARGTVGSSSPDAPFTPAELEAILRPYDVDAGELPGRLAALAPSLLGDHNHREVTTDGWDVPTPAVALPPELREDSTISPTWDSASLLPGRRATSVVDLLRAKLQKENASAPLSEDDLNAAIARLLPPETIAGLRMDLNRLFGNGLDSANNPNNVIDEPGEADTAMGASKDISYPQVNAGDVDAPTNTLDPDNDGTRGTDYANTFCASERQLYARQLYSLMLLLMNYHVATPGSPTDAERAISRQVAQWAINIVDFRDRDAVMTPFEYDIDPFTDADADDNPWDVDGILASSSLDNAETYRGLVWGCERPELLITETLATHNQRAQDTAMDPSGRLTTSTPPDEDFDQVVVPHGALFIELYNPSTANEPRPGEFYGTGQGINLRATTADGSPVWRLRIVQGDVVDASGQPRDPDDPDHPPADDDFLRSIYFVDPGALDLGADGHRFFPEADSPIAPLLPDRYAVIGPEGEDGATDGVTHFGLKLDGTPSARQIILNPSNDPDHENQVRIVDNEQDSALDMPPGLKPPIAIRIPELNVSIPLSGDPDAYPDLSTAVVDRPVDYDRTQTDADGRRMFAELGGHRRAFVVHLERLANPLANYHRQTNPYRTVDTMLMDLTTFNGSETRTDPGAPAPQIMMFEAFQRGETNAAENNLWTQPNRLKRRVESPRETTGPGGAVHRFPYILQHSLGYLTDDFGPRTDLVASPPHDYRGAPQQPFPWLAWLNRPFVSAGELLLVPRSRSSQLLNHFGIAPTSPDPYQNPYDPFYQLINYYYDTTAVTDDPNWKLHRLLEFVRVPSRFVGTELQGSPTAFTEDTATTGNPPTHSFHPPLARISEYREPGKVNLNTIASRNVWRGLMNHLPGCDAAWIPFVDSRRGYSGTPGNQFQLDATGHLPTRFARPFRSYMGRYLVPTPALQTAVGGDETDATLLREGATAGQPLLGFASTEPVNNTDRNPAFRYQLLNRLENMTTTRSNVYAVWITVGYFEVTPISFDDPDNDGFDPQGRTRAQFAQIYPDGYQLGAELGSDTGEVRRHRAFSIIDRSIPVGFERGADLNVEKTILVRRFIE